MILKKEMQTYRKKLPELLADEGKYVLIKGTKTLGVYKNRDSALKAAYQILGPRVPFLVKKIEAVETIIRLPYDARMFLNVSHKNAAHRKRRRSSSAGRS